jgi:hypothetical protein
VRAIFGKPHIVVSLNEVDQAPWRTPLCPQTGRKCSPFAVNGLALWSRAYVLYGTLYEHRPENVPRFAVQDRQTTCTLAGHLLFDSKLVEATWPEHD